MKTNCIRNSLLLTDYYKIVAEFSRYRIDDYERRLKEMQARGARNVLPFIRGLRLSAQLIYSIRKSLVGNKYAADWGHLLSKNGDLLSRECDIIIYENKPGVVIAQWNGAGNTQQIMDFKFIDQGEAKLVISCKAQIRNPSDIDKEYCKDINKYVKKIWLFAECCNPDNIESIREKAKMHGYEKYYYLYSWKSDSPINNNEREWIKFKKEICRIFAK